LGGDGGVGAMFPFIPLFRGIPFGGVVLFGEVNVLTPFRTPLVIAFRLFIPFWFGLFNPFWVFG